MKVIFAGERGSFAELAAREYFGHDVPLQQVKLFEDVFESVKRDVNVRGIIPIENTKAGSVHKNYDLLLESKCSIVGEIYLKIEQCLIANKGVTLRKIRRVFSHPQALEQCRNFLKKHPKIKQYETVNTAAAVKMIKEEKLTDAAAIASLQAAIDFDMEILGQNIQDDKNNMTRFLILSKKPQMIEKSDLPIKTSIVFSMKNIPGALFRSLAVFSLRDIDLYKIESRPMFGHGFQYLFYLDFEGDAKAEKPRRALNHLQEMTTFYRFLGSYPVGRTVDPKYVKRS
ncbi:MAG: prephenate dehydratase [Chitinispirillaceae bacterium]|nr:prephenate dehydratase [Chitinispirillaceae bacterium]